jgi:hypothetical protein
MIRQRRSSRHRRVNVPGLVLGKVLHAAGIVGAFHLDGLLAEVRRKCQGGGIVDWVRPECEAKGKR